MGQVRTFFPSISKCDPPREPMKNVWFPDSISSIRLDAECMAR